MFVLAGYAFFIFFLTKKLYDWMINKRIKKSVAIYYNRKIMHIFAGGIVVLAVPFVFSNPWYPLISGLVLTVFTYLAHRRGNVFYWFQTKDNINDVSKSHLW